MKNYWMMFSSRGLRLPISYFFECHLFDIIHRSDTHNWLPKEAYEQEPPNFENGFAYMSSWTKEIKQNFAVAEALLGSSFPEYAFLDVGCGKGKVVLVWEKEIRKKNYNQFVAGIDYYAEFIGIAKNNYHKIFGGHGNFLCEDATNMNLTEFGNKIILYMYNPFDDVMLRTFMKKLERMKVLLIYNNPIYENVLREHGFTIVHERKGFHPNQHTVIFTNTERVDDD